MLHLSLGECLQVALYRHWHSSLHLHTEQQSIRLSHHRHKRVTKCTSLRLLLCKTPTTALPCVLFFFSILYVNLFFERELLGVNCFYFIQLSGAKESLSCVKGFMVCYMNPSDRSYNIGIIFVVSGIVGFLNNI